MGTEQFPELLQASVVFIRPSGGAPWRAGEGLSDPVRRGTGRAVSAWPLDRRIVVESPAGMAIVGLGPLREARAAAQRAATDGSLSVALHRGPLDVVTGADGVRRATGPGIDEAARQAARSDGGLGESDAFTQAAAAEARRRLLGFAALGGLLVAGGLVRVARQRFDAARKPALVQLEIKPWGEVFVDGEPKGTAPPLAKLWIAPGAHTIEIRNGRFKPLRMEVQLRPGEELQVVHTFDAPARRRGLWDRLKFW